MNTSGRFLISMVILYGIPSHDLSGGKWYLAIKHSYLIFLSTQQFDISGNQAICYYNFLCSQQLQITSSFSFAAFNNVYSNVGYIILGLLILLLNHRRYQTILREGRGGGF